MLSNRVRAALQTTVLATAAGGFLAACGEEEVDQEAYCVNQSGQVVNEQSCDTGGDGTFIYMGGVGSHRVGDKIPPGSSLIKSNDAQARAKAGLPATGKVTGTRIAGGIGKGVGGGTGGGGKGAGS
jgi:hypothetical protein